MNYSNEKTLKSDEVFCGRVFRCTVDMVELDNGHTAQREVVWHNGGVVIIPRLANGDFVLVQQYRYPLQKVILEFPAGKLEKDEDPELAAHRELKEETGYTSDNLRFLGVLYPAPGFCSEKLYIYSATDLLSGDQCLDVDEFLGVCHMTTEQLQSAITQNIIQDSKTISAFAMLATH